MKSNSVHMNRVHKHKRKIFYLNDFHDDREKAPFDHRKDAVIIGRGNRNKDRFLFDLERLNIFFLNFAPPQWAYDFYSENFSKRMKDSIYAFIHGAHIDALKPGLDSKVNIITWRAQAHNQMFTVKNCLGKCAEYLGKTLRGRNIYLCALDFDEYRPNRAWEMDRDALKIAMRNHGTHLDGPYNYRNKYIFVTPNRYYTTHYMPIPVVTQYREKLKRDKYIVREVN